MSGGRIDREADPVCATSGCRDPDDPQSFGRIGFDGHDPDRARDYCRDVGAPLVVKADGLAAGKGAIV